MKTEMRPAYYALPSGAWRDYVTLLHWPYSLWHLSYVVLGSAAAPTLHLDRLAVTVLAFFLAVGVGAHALDEYNGRPLRTQVSDFRLLVLAATSIGAAILVGLAAAVAISPWALPFVAFGGFIVVAYNLEWWGGRFHSDLWFAVSWGAFPALVGYWASAQRLDAEAVLIGAACLMTSLAQRTLSKHAKVLRRAAVGASGRFEFSGGRWEAITVPGLLQVPEASLRLLGFSVVLLSAGFLVARL